MHSFVGRNFGPCVTKRLPNTYRKPGAKSRLVFKFGKGKMEMIETITRKNLPDEFDGPYDAPGVFNIVKNRFIVVRAWRFCWRSKALLKTGQTYE